MPIDNADLTIYSWVVEGVTGWALGCVSFFFFKSLKQIKNSAFANPRF